MNAAEWFGQRVEESRRHVEESRRHRQEMRERALYNATQLHCETGDSMAIFNRASVARDVLDTAEEFYAWITAEGTEQ
ncbi:hypothetical protein KL858_33840 [Mycolicibacterium goodii]|nr:hypothetical protein [Mycolicibacterium goodii]